MKYQVDWIKVIVFFLVAGGLILITGSFLMSLGIFLLLLIIDGFIQQWQNKKEFEKKWKELMEQEKKKRNE
jgi:sugar phosphate permease